MRNLGAIFVKQDDSDSKDLPVPGQTDHLCISRMSEIMNKRNEIIGGYLQFQLKPCEATIQIFVWSGHGVVTRCG